MTENGSDRPAPAYQPDERIRRAGRLRLLFVLALSTFMLVVAVGVMVWMYVLGAPLPT